jgi:hypothetical protein
LPEELDVFCPYCRFDLHDGRQPALRATARVRARDRAVAHVANMRKYLARVERVIGGRQGSHTGSVIRVVIPPPVVRSSEVVPTCAPTVDAATDALLFTSPKGKPLR